MPVNTVEMFPASVNNWEVEVSTANTNRDGTTGTYADLIATGGNTSGVRVDRVVIKAAGTTHAGVVRLFLGTKLVAEVTVPASAPAAAGITFSQELSHPDGGPLYLLSAGVALKVSTHIADAFHVHAFGATYELIA